MNVWRYSMILVLIAAVIFATFMLRYLLEGGKLQ